jgi:hypothetical protein
LPGKRCPGRTVGPGISWQCRRAEGRCIPSDAGRHLAELLGCLEQPGLDATNWLAEHTLRFGAFRRKAWGGKRTGSGAPRSGSADGDATDLWAMGRFRLELPLSAAAEGGLSLAAPSLSRGPARVPPSGSAPVLPSSAFCGDLPRQSNAQDRAVAQPKHGVGKSWRQVGYHRPGGRARAGLQGLDSQAGPGMAWRPRRARRGWKNGGERQRARQEGLMGASLQEVKDALNHVPVHV